MTSPRPRALCETVTQPFVAVLDYGIGNLRSAEKALCRVGAEARLVTDPAEVEAADGVVLPGVGSFGRCRQALAASGLEDAAVAAARSGRPFIGICVGMQLLYEGSEESPGVAGLGLVPGTVRLLPEGVRRPQIQWNRLDVRPGTRLLAGLEDDAWVYFVHSYYAAVTDHVVATCQYGTTVAAVLENDNLWATQFHPEKSSTVGLAILANFVAACAR
jgi:glutamine amidotransferase